MERPFLKVMSASLCTCEVRRYRPVLSRHKPLDWKGLLLQYVDRPGHVCTVNVFVLSGIWFGGHEGIQPRTRSMNIWVQVESTIDRRWINDKSKMNHRWSIVAVECAQVCCGCALICVGHAHNTNMLSRVPTTALCWQNSMACDGITLYLRISIKWWIMHQRRINNVFQKWISDGQCGNMASYCVWA